MFSRLACALFIMLALPAFVFGQADPFADLNKAAASDKPDAAAAAAPAEAEASEDPNALFDELFGSEVQRVSATSDPSDDLELAATLLSAAQGTKDDPAMLIVLCEQAAALAAKSPDGADTTSAALQLLLDSAPDKRLSILEKLVDTRQRQYLKTPIADRPAAGDTLISTMLDLAGAQVAEGDPAAAIITYRRANTIAGAIRSDRRDEIKTLLDDAVDAQRIQNQIEVAKQRLKSNSNDKASANELIRLHVVELDDPTEARKYTFLTDDETLKNNIRLASGDQDELTEPDAMALGEWYKDLAGTAGSARSRAMMLQHAQGYFDRYLSMHDTQDLMHTKATLERNRIGEQLALLEKQLGPAGLPTSSRRSSWINLLEHIDLSRHTAGDDAGRWKLSDGVLSNVMPHSTLILPVDLTGSYDFELVIRRREARNGRTLIEFPVGAASVKIYCYTEADDLPNAFTFIKGMKVMDEANPTRFRYPMNEQGRNYTVGVKVRVVGEKCELAVSIDGKAGTKWTGLVKDVAPRYNLDTGHNFNLQLYKLLADVRGLRVRAVSGGKAEINKEVGGASRTKPVRPGVAAGQGIGGLQNMARQFTEAWARAGEQQKQVIANALRQRLDRMPKPQRQFILGEIKRSGNKDLVKRMYRDED